MLIKGEGIDDSILVMFWITIWIHKPGRIPYHYKLG